MSHYLCHRNIHIMKITFYPKIQTFKLIDLCRSISTICDHTATKNKIFLAFLLILV